MEQLAQSAAVYTLDKLNCEVPHHLPSNQNHSLFIYNISIQTLHLKSDPQGNAKQVEKIPGKAAICMGFRSEG